MANVRMKSAALPDNPAGRTKPSSDVVELAPPRSPGATNLEIARLRMTATAAMASGNLDHADEVLVQAMRLARERGNGTERISLLALFLDIRLLRASSGGLASINAFSSATDLATRLARLLMPTGTNPEESPRNELVVDVATRLVRLPSGLVVNFGRSPRGLRVLEFLARSRGRAPIAAIVMSAWRVETYERWRDTRRFRAVIGHVRKLVEEDPRRPVLLVRDGDSYRLTVPARLIE